MKKAYVLSLIFGLAILTAPLALPADEPDETAPQPEKITVKSDAQAKGIRLYKVTVDIKGKMPADGAAEPTDLDAVYTLYVEHKYGRWDRDGLRSLEISVTKGEAKSGGLSLTVTETMFPKMTILLKRDGSVSSVFGISGTRYEKSIPGINYVNMILLFRLWDGDKPHATGETWTARTILPTYKETYEFNNTIKSLTDIDTTRSAVVHQDITWTPRREEGVPDSTVHATADSTFALDDGKLLKCNAQSEVSFKASEQDLRTHRANIKIDISYVK